MDSGTISLNVEVKNFLESVAKNQGFEEFNIKTDAGSLKGDGYLGVITAAEISNEQEILNLVVKLPEKNDHLRNRYKILYQREKYMYQLIIPALEKFEIEHNLPPISTFAKFYNGPTASGTDIIALENLKTKRYSVHDRRTPLNEEHVTLVLKQYAHLHALSFALKDQDPQLFTELTQSMDDVYVKFFTPNILMYKNHCYKALRSLFPIKDTEVYNAFKKLADGSTEFLLNLHELVDQYSVILHGDGWTSNLMFAYDDQENPNRPTKLCFIDLQLARLGSPVLDIAYFLFICASKNIITDLQRYLDTYYSNIAAHIKVLGSDPEKVYPKRIFHQQWREYAKFGLIAASFIIKLMLSEQNEVTDIAQVVESGKNAVDAFNYDIAKVEEYDDKLRHIILYAAENKLL